MPQNNLIYDVNDKPSWGKTFVFAFQQLLAILAATIAVPAIVGNGMSPSAALFGAGVGTLVYLIFTKFRSPVFLGSSFAFIGPMLAAFGGAASASAGYLGIIIGAILAGLVYVAIAIIVRFVGAKWITKIMPSVVIGPTVAIIGLSLAGNAISDLTKGSYIPQGADVPSANIWIALVCGLVTLFVTIIVATYGKKTLKMIPFIIGILAGYSLAILFTGIGYGIGEDALKVIDLRKFLQMEWLPKFTFIEAFNGFKDFKDAGDFFSYFAAIFVAYVPVAFVVFAEHIADHKNLSSIIGRDLTEDPGLHRTLLGDGVGSMAGAFFGGCPNTTYGESIGTVAISKNASIRTIIVTAGMAVVLAFVAPFSTFLATIPSCVMGGVCIALYGFIAVSGLKMIQSVDLGDNRNLFVVSVILIAGVGGLTLSVGHIKLTTVACALILGILVNLVVNIKGRKAAAAKAVEAKENEVANDENVE